MESLGFYVCVADLEDELIRCLGAACVARVVDAHPPPSTKSHLIAEPGGNRREIASDGAQCSELGDVEYEMLSAEYLG
jgi:hypothetical protein